MVAARSAPGELGRGRLQTGGAPVANCGPRPAAAVAPWVVLELDTGHFGAVPGQSQRRVFLNLRHCIAWWQDGRWYDPVAQWLRNGTALAALAVLPIGTIPLCC